jgi:hypothetical protein
MEQNMATVPVYVEALSDREVLLHSEGVETEEESPPAPEGAVIEPFSVSVISNYRIPEGGAVGRVEDLLSQVENQTVLCRKHPELASD